MTNNENNTRALHLVGEARYQLERALETKIDEAVFAQLREEIHAD